MRWDEVKVMYAREMRAALRERTIIVNSILIPVLLYPFMLWAVFTGISFVQGQTEGFVSRVAVIGSAAERPALMTALGDDDHVQIEDPGSLQGSPEDAVRDGRLDAVITLQPPPAGAESVPGNLQALITFNGSSERSAAARKRLANAVSEFRQGWLLARAEALGITEPAWQAFTIESRNIASGREMGGFLLGLMLPVFFVIMVAVGCFYPAVDATAGERERETWETLMTVAADRSSIVASKYLYVATFGCVAGALNLLAMVVSIRAILSPLLAEEDVAIEFGLPLTSLPLLLASAVLLAGFVAAGMMIFAAFARTFKEGQAMITPFYLLILLPVMFLQVPGLRLTVPLAMVPIVNVTMMIRGAIQGTLSWLPVLVTFVVGGAAIAACLFLASFILRYEDVVVGSFAGSFSRFVKQRLLRRSRTEGASS